jgi:hypothetical protein
MQYAKHARDTIGFTPRSRNDATIYLRDLLSCSRIAEQRMWGLDEWHFFPSLELKGGSGKKPLVSVLDRNREKTRSE